MVLFIFVQHVCYRRRSPLKPRPNNVRSLKITPTKHRVSTPSQQV
ncbi:hypothetical protein [Mastigocladopsis repens]|nr:hypothetical protein [Mastigocladopsis repens]